MIYSLNIRTLQPRTLLAGRSNAIGILILANQQNKRGHNVLFYFALGAIRLGFAPRSQKLTFKPCGLAGSFCSLSGFTSLHPSANPPNALTRLLPCARSVNLVKTDKTEDRSKPILCFMRLARFERATYPLKGECSTC